jgi:hypothetical protein
MDREGAPVAAGGDDDVERGPAYRRAVEVDRGGVDRPRPGDLAVLQPADVLGGDPGRSAGPVGALGIEAELGPAGQRLTFSWRRRRIGCCALRRPCGSRDRARPGRAARARAAGADQQHRRSGESALPALRFPAIHTHRERASRVGVPRLQLDVATRLRDALHLKRLATPREMLRSPRSVGAGRRHPSHASIDDSALNRPRDSNLRCCSMP